MYALMTTLTSTTSPDYSMFQNVDFSALTSVASTLAATITTIGTIEAASVEATLVSAEKSTFWNIE